MIKLAVYTVLLSMVLHCACKLGLLNRIYQNRHEIAYNIGLIAEIPIAMCNSDYHSNTNLKIEIQESDSAVPPLVFQAFDINLFFVTTQVKISVDHYLLSVSYFPVFTNNLSEKHLLSVFHPPAHTTTAR